MVGIPLSSFLLEKNDGQVGGRWVCVGSNSIIHKLFQAVSSTNTDRNLHVRLYTVLYLLITGLN